MVRALVLLVAVAGFCLFSGTAVASHTGTPDKNCSDFATQAEAQQYFIEHGGPASDPDGLDGNDHDGLACESLPCPCNKGGTSPQPDPDPIPPADSDADGKPDSEDACPTQAAPTANGCPAPTPPSDKDGDGKPDTTDACPTKAGGRSNGCPNPEVLKGRLVSVVDGDTIKVKKGKHILTVRLIGIDTPESKKPGTPVECGALDAAKNLTKLALRTGKGRNVTLTTDPTQDRNDRYGRLLAYAKVDSGKVLQVEQLRSGWATVYVFDNKPFERFIEFRQQAVNAFNAKRGVWGHCDGDFHSAPRATSAARSYERCGNGRDVIYDIRSSGASCRRARRVARRWLSRASQSVGVVPS